MADHLATKLTARARDEISGQPSTNRFLDLLEAGEVPRERLTWLAGEEYRIVTSDRRSFAQLAARYPGPPAGDMFLGLAQGEGQALGLLSDYAAALGWGPADLRAYQPRPFAQAYPAYLAWCALNGTRSGVALAMLANLDEWGAFCARTAQALQTRYDLSEQAVGFFRFFAEPPPGFADQANAVIAAGLEAGEDANEALLAARMLHTYETAFWDALAEGLP